MTEPTSCEPATIVSSDVRTLMLLMQSPEPAVCAAATEAIVKFADASAKNKTLLLSMGVIRHLIELCISKDANIKKAAVACLSSISESTENHEDMRRKELIDVLISVLVPGEAIEVQDEAAFAIANLAKDFASKVDIRKAGGMKALVTLLESSDPDVKKNVAMALSVMLEDFSNRSEIRYLEGIGPLVELLASEYPEIQENALLSLIKCSEDLANRAEIRKNDGIRRILDLISREINSIHTLALQCLSVCLEDNDTAAIIADLQGLLPLLKLVSCDESKVRKAASHCIARACAKNERNQIFARENGALVTFVNNLNHSDPNTISSAAVAIRQLGKNDANQQELIKLNTSDIIFRLLNHDDVEVRRESVGALGSLCLNAKFRTRIRGSEGIASIIKLLSQEDIYTVVNAADCVANLAEDVASRSDLIRASVIPALLAALDRHDPKISSAVALAIARCTQEQEGQIVLAKQPGQKGILRLVELAGNKDVSVARNATYALSMTCLLEQNAVAACNAGVIEILITIQRDVTKNSKFAADALQKILNHNLSAKYWLGNGLDSENVITDGFYDIGFAGGNLDTIRNFPFLVELQQAPVDKRREIILVDSNNDPSLSSILMFAYEAIQGKPPILQIQILATIVSKVMGGAIHPEKISEFAFKFRITELKLKSQSNVIPIGEINQGTFYHRALLFKVLCDRFGISPCVLIRGEYHRAWNVIEMKKQTGATKKYGTHSLTSASIHPKAPTPSGGGGRERGIQRGNTVTLARGDTASSITATLSASNGASSAAPSAVEILLQSIDIPTEIPSNVVLKPAIVDLMFEPGRLLPLETPEATSYQRMV